MQTNKKIGLSVRKKYRFQDNPDVEISTQDFRAAIREKMITMTTQMRKSLQRK